MHDHLRDLLQRFHYSEQLQETAAFRILLGGEDPRQVMAALHIHHSYTLRHWGSQYPRQS
jgi:transposase